MAQSDSGFDCIETAFYLLVVAFLFHKTGVHFCEKCSICLLSHFFFTKPVSTFVRNALVREFAINMTNLTRHCHARRLSRPCARKASVE